MDEYFYEDELRRMLEEFGDLYDFSECELTCEFGVCNIFIHNYTIYILN